MLELEHISFDVPGEQGQKEIIRDISLTIPAGRFVAITGPNGGGKSTLAKLIAGIEKPTAGRILLNGEDITQMSITENGPTRASAMPSSSRSASRASRCWTCCASPPARSAP